MAYTVPTADELQVRYPAFAAVADVTVTAAITEAQRTVDVTWTEGDYANGIMLYACHLMTQDGLGVGAPPAGLAGFRSIKSGALSLERGAAADVSAASLASTTYGQRFARLLRLNKGGMRVAASTAGYPYNPIAYDS